MAPVTIFSNKQPVSSGFAMCLPNVATFLRQHPMKSARQISVFWRTFGAGILLIVCGLALPAFSQQPDTAAVSGSVDSLENPWRRDVHPSDRFDITVGRGFLINTSPTDTAPIQTATSGSYTIGVGVNLLIAPKVYLRLQPSFNFFKLVFNENDAQRFPSLGDSLQNEKIRLTFIRLPILASWIIQRSPETGRTVYSADFGLSPAFRLNDIFKSETTTSDGEKLNLKQNSIKGEEPFRLSMIAALSYKSLTLWTSFRLTDVFDQSETYVAPDGQTSSFPTFPAWQLGLEIRI